MIYTSSLRGLIASHKKWSHWGHHLIEPPVTSWVTLKLDQVTQKVFFKWEGWGLFGKPILVFQYEFEYKLQCEIYFSVLNTHLLSQRRENKSRTDFGTKRYTENSLHLLLKSLSLPTVVLGISFPVKIFVSEHFFNLLSTETSALCPLLPFCWLWAGWADSYYVCSFRKTRHQVFTFVLYLPNKELGAAVDWTILNVRKKLITQATPQSKTSAVYFQG